jgi:uncharacterized membrane protein required for colicin V production
MFGLMKLVFAIVFIGFVAIGTLFGGLIGFVITLLIALVFSGMFSRIEKSKLEENRHKEMIQSIEKNKKD